MLKVTFTYSISFLKYILLILLNLLFPFVQPISAQESQSEFLLSVYFYENYKVEILIIYIYIYLFIYTDTNNGLM
jgi:hypothetical protein